MYVSIYTRDSTAVNHLHRKEIHHLVFFSLDQTSLCLRQRCFSDEMSVLVALALLRDDRQARMLPLTSTKRFLRQLFILVATVQSVSQFARHLRVHGLLKVRRKDDCERLVCLISKWVVQFEPSTLKHENINFCFIWKERDRKFC